MARQIAADGLELFRAVVTVTTETDGVTTGGRTSYYGPYNGIGQAKARVTDERHAAESLTSTSGLRAARHGTPAVVRRVEGRVERAEVTWVPVT